MTTTSIDAGMVKEIFLAGAANLEAKKEWINDLNVFPVPDGDTGTNMTLTIMSASKEVSNIETPDMESLAKAISSGSLRGARGNSGVILSQLLRGFTKVIREYDAIDSRVLSLAFEKAVETAYKAVMKPKEGTILTVARGMSEKMTELAPKISDIKKLLGLVIEYGDEVLNYTPELLPVLKQAGVVDSGGQGLMQLMKGAYDALMGKKVDYSNVISESKPAAGKETTAAKGIEDVNIEFGYCTEFIVNIEKKYGEKEEAAFKAFLESIGNSIVIVSDDEIVKVHVHTNHPGLAFEEGLKYGSLSRMKVDNMREEHEERLIANASKVAGDNKETEHKEAEEEIVNEKYGFISVSAGDGLTEIFKCLGVNYVIEGGQTMNPSTEDMLNAIENVHADNIFILPNNSNIILAANQAQSIVEDKNVIVVPTKTVPQGISALLAYSEEAAPEDNFNAMSEEIARVKSGSVTYAVRDTEVDDKVIRQGDIMGIGDKTILSVGQNISEVTKDLIDNLMDDDSELISIYYGNDIEEASAEELAKQIEEAYPDADVELNYGGQPIYYYIVSVE
ncbi:DAK2 domain-containing protein [Eshraghiella crossota]|nr:DAK2 domain-containing protein [Butyrivibrio crossotus]MEE0314770.1 DAK2 domain-containing protein [Butyrivibrio crossotus]UWO49784.1 DAK2 domain-containing protein [Butyrivibrio crossotus]